MKTERTRRAARLFFMYASIFACIAFWRGFVVLVYKYIPKSKRAKKGNTDENKSILFFYRGAVVFGKMEKISNFPNMPSKIRSMK